MLRSWSMKTAQAVCLGPQAVGGAGICTSPRHYCHRHHFQGTVHDLAQLDLAYAPPFGSAKDPVHMERSRRRRARRAGASSSSRDADPAAYQVVDVRDAIEIADLPLANAPHASNPPSTVVRPQRRMTRDRGLCPQRAASSHSHAHPCQHGFTAVFNLSGAASCATWR